MPSQPSATAKSTPSWLRFWRPASARSSTNAKWQCEACAHESPASLMVCEQCDQPRPPVPSQVPSQASTETTPCNVAVPHTDSARNAAPRRPTSREVGERAANLCRSMSATNRGLSLSQARSMGAEAMGVARDLGLTDQQLAALGVAGASACNPTAGSLVSSAAVRAGHTAAPRQGAAATSFLRQMESVQASGGVKSLGQAVGLARSGLRAGQELGLTPSQMARAGFAGAAAARSLARDEQRRPGR